MKCPVCKEPMVILELNEIEIDHCISCKGVWLDAGELELLLGNSQGKDALLASFKEYKDCKEKNKKCPICLKKMQKVLCGIEKKVCLDKCKNNHGIWFDVGELEELIKAGSFDKDNNVLNLLKDMFGK
ncbi:MAG: zf-TFIIB domain-containing protein [Candidatus Firestonebacteria bacterium]|nr:zf-TFIIB domain-containing protein [Candidatus Firestonebacteria bacterium]